MGRLIRHNLAVLKVIVDNRIRIRTSKLDPKILKELESEFRYSNPEFGKRRAIGISTWGVPREISLVRRIDGYITFPRGGMYKIRDVLSANEIPFKTIDRRSEGAPCLHFPKYIGPELRYYQEAGIQAALKKENCVIRAPTASGKSLMAIALAARIGLNTLVILPTVALFNQWVKDAREALDLRSIDIGIIHGSKRVLRPVTAAVQKSLAVRGIDQELLDFFGVVVVDECFTSETEVLMADGTLRPIASLRVGDITAVGGRVTATMSRWYVGTCYQVGKALSTADHPVATSRGWVSVSKVCSSDVLWYDPLHEERLGLCDLWKQDAQRFKASRLCQTPSGEFHRWKMCHLREDCFEETTRVSQIFALRNQVCLEQGVGNRRRSENRSLCLEAPRTITAGSCKPHEITLRRSEISSASQDRSGPPRRQNSRRDRWFESPLSIENQNGSEEDLLPRVEGVARSPLPGSVRLFEGSANVHAFDAFPIACRVYNIETENGVYVAGGVLVHNCQKAAAATYIEVIDPWPARYRIGVSADERRQDKKDFLTRDLFGLPAYEIKRETLESQGHVLDVEIRVIPTDFRAEWYGIPESEEDEKKLDFTRLVDEMTLDKKRDALALDFAVEEAKAGKQVIVLTHRREHCHALDRRFVDEQIPTGFFIGGQDFAKQFEETRNGIADKSLRVGIGTYSALGVGVNLPSVSVGVAMTPVAGNKFNFNQVRGRLSRQDAKGGKTHGILYVLWDKNVYPSHLNNLIAWNPTVRIWKGRKWLTPEEFRKRGG